MYNGETFGIFNDPIEYQNNHVVVTRYLYGGLDKRAMFNKVTHQVIAHQSTVRGTARAWVRTVMRRRVRSEMNRQSRIRVQMDNIDRNMRSYQDILLSVGF